MQVRSEDFSELIGEELSGVTFVRDYIQLQFNPPPLLNAYTPVTVHAGARVARSGAPDFPATLVSQIDKHVRRVELRPGRALDIHFEDESLVSVSLRSSDYCGPEALTLTRLNGEMIVV